MNRYELKITLHDCKLITNLFFFPKTKVFVWFNELDELDLVSHA